MKLLHKYQWFKWEKGNKDGIYSISLNYKAKWVKFFRSHKELISFILLLLKFKYLNFGRTYKPEGIMILFESKFITLYLAWDKLISENISYVRLFWFFYHYSQV